MRSIRQHRHSSRRGASSIEFTLILGVTFSIAAWVVQTGIQTIRAVYEMICVWIAWPFM